MTLRGEGIESRSARKNLGKELIFRECEPNHDNGLEL